MNYFLLLVVSNFSVDVNFKRFRWQYRNRRENLWEL